MNNLKQLITTKLSILWWTLKYIGAYFLLNFQSISTISKNYIFIFLLFVLVTPWLSGKVWLSLSVDILSVFLFLQLLQDKIQIENEKEKSKQRIQNEIEIEAEEIVEFLGEIGFPEIKKLREGTAQEIVQGINDYEYFDNHRFKYILRLSDLLLKIQVFDDRLKYYLRYLIFSELKTKYRQKYIDECIDAKNLETPNSIEESLIKQVAYRAEVGSVCRDNSYETRKINADKYLILEFGNKIEQVKINKIIADKDRAERFKKVLAQGIVNGVISERGLESITRNQNKLLVIIKYGEGTSQKGWPKAEGAPFAKVLRKNKFEKPYYQDDFAFIRDLSANPVNGDLENYINKLTKDLNEDFQLLKQKYKNREIIQSGPYYEILAFIADKQNFAWRLSRKRNFNSFVSKILLNEVLDSNFSQDFIRANYFKIKNIIENISWFSMLSNEKLKKFIEENIKKIDRDLSTSNISLDNLFDLVSLKPEQVDLLEGVIYNVIKKRNISVRKSKTSDKEKRTVIKRQLKSLMEEAEHFTSIIRELEK